MKTEIIAIMNSNLKSGHYVVSGLISPGYGHADSEGAAVPNGFNHPGLSSVSAMFRDERLSEQAKDWIYETAKKALMQNVVKQGCQIWGSV